MNALGIDGKDHVADKLTIGLRGSSGVLAECIGDDKLIESMRTAILEFLSNVFPIGQLA